MQMEPAELVQRTVDLIKSFNPSVATIDTHAHNVLGEVKEVCIVMGRYRS